MSTALVQLILASSLSVTALASWTADNLDGTYTNPIRFGDYPDNDVIRVGDWFYNSTTTMQNMPGCHILKSRDLVNWEPVGGAIKSIDDPQHRLERGWVYGGGPWASSIRYHEKNKKFYVLTACNNLTKTILSYADRVEGPWTTIELKDQSGKDVFLYDASLFFDDDGNNYVISQRETPNVPTKNTEDNKSVFAFDGGISDPSYIRVTKLSDDCLSVVERPKKLFRALTSSGEPQYTEGLRAYKVNGMYYILAIGGSPNVAFRSKSLVPAETWETKRGVLSDRFNSSQGFPKQASIVQTQTGEWWGIAFQDYFPIGRMPLLFPVKWIDGWPMFGPNGDGKGVTTFTKPNVGNSLGKPAPAKASDSFDNAKLRPIWELNHNPDDTKWSLTERPGYLRLKTAKVVKDETDIFNARNTLIQRCQGPSSVATVEMDVSHITEGDVAGLCNFQNPYGYIGVQLKGGRRSILMVNNNTRVAEMPLNQDKVYFRFDYKEPATSSDFYYSLDGFNFTKLGNTLITYPVSQRPLFTFNGNKFGLFNFATKSLGGFVDVHAFKMFNPAIGNRFSAFQRIEAERYDVRQISDFQDAKDTVGGKDQCTLNANRDDYLGFNHVNFYGGAKSISLRARTREGVQNPSKISVRLDDLKNAPIAEITIPVTHGMWQDVTAPIQNALSRHRLYLTFEDSNTDLSSFTFIPIVYQAAFKTSKGYMVTPDANTKRTAPAYFEIEQAGPNQISIKSPNGKYLSVGADGKITASAVSQGEKELFSLVDIAGENQVALVAQGNLQFVKIVGHKLVAQADEWNEAEPFTLNILVNKRMKTGLSK